MKVEYDKETNALYIKIADIERGRDGSCEELVEDVVIIDRNKEGIITGIEVLGVESIENL